MDMVTQDHLYREILLEPLRKCASYLPKMGGEGEVDFDGFSRMYGADPLYHWMGLDTELMFAAHKAAGGMTSIYRQLGIGCERLFRQTLRDQLKLDAEQVKWSYQVVLTATKHKTLTLDGRIELSEIQDQAARDRVAAWIEDQRAALGISTPLRGAVFEVRQGYKSADSKRQNGDIANAAQALADSYLPVLAVMSTQINRVVHERYLVNNWAVLLGSVGAEDSLRSTFDFLREVVGYDLEAFFARNADSLRAETELILRQLLEAK